MITDNATRHPLSLVEVVADAERSAAPSTTFAAVTRHPGAARLFVRAAIRAGLGVAALGSAAAGYRNTFSDGSQLLRWIAGVALLALAVRSLSAGMRRVRCTVSMEPDAIVVGSLFRSRRVAWSDITEVTTAAVVVRTPKGGRLLLAPELVLADDRRVPVFALLLDPGSPAAVEAARPALDQLATEAAAREIAAPLRTTVDAADVRTASDSFAAADRLGVLNRNLGDAGLTARALMPR